MADEVEAKVVAELLLAAVVEEVLAAVVDPRAGTLEEVREVNQPAAVRRPDEAPR